MDVDLLTSAAKAANLPYEWCEAWKTMAKPHPDGGYIFEEVWNPLVNDADALRLAAQLKISIRFWSNDDVVAGDLDDDDIYECTSGDPCSSVRRAIVRAAAKVKSHGEPVAGSFKIVEGDYTTLFRISREGIWANPDAPVNETAQKVIEALESYIKELVQKAVEAEREACAAVCENDPDQAGDWLEDSRPGLSFAARIRARSNT